MDLCDEFLTSLPIESGLLSERIDFTMDDIASSSCDELLDHNSRYNPYSVDASDSVAAKRMKTELTYKSSSSSESIDYIDFGPDELQTVNPDDFLNDLFKSEIKSEVGNSPSRDTPSPSNSSTSSDFNEFRIEMPANDDNQQVASSPSNFTFETPPISPPSPGASSSSSSSSLTSSIMSTTMLTQRQCTTVPFNFTANTVPKLNILHGTLIPISTMSLSATPSKSSTNLLNFKKIKIQPKPITTTTITSTIAGTDRKQVAPPKRIVLSAQDYKALVQKCKTQPTNGSMKPLILKTASAAGTNKFQNSQLCQKNDSGTTTTRPIMLSSTSNTFASVAKARLSAPIPSMCTIATASATKTLEKTTMKKELEEKIMKKHQRMIKNRESACLSRKKKKDYMTSLETQVTSLWEENEKLRTENGFLRDRMTQLESMVCKCGQSVSRQLSTVLNASNKKNAVFLLAVMFMVSLNFGPFGNLFSTQMSAQNLKDTSVVEVHHGRGLLWVEDDNKNNKNRTSNSTNEYDDTLTSPTTTTTDTTINTYPTCPLVHVNQTESVRLASELRRWIGDLPEPYNISSDQGQQQPSFDINSIPDYLFPDDTIKSLFHQIKHVKNYIKKKSKRREAGASVQQQQQQQQSHNDIIATQRPHTNKIQVYNPNNRHDIKYAELFEELRRQDDTFYVVSFSGDHLLLPALAHNQTFRPKMSLMLPSVGPNGTFSSEYITLMQIDCEVVNTSLIRIKEKLIPKHLRNKTTAGEPSTSGTEDRTARRTATDRTFNRVSQPNYTISENVSNAATVSAKDFDKLYKPYFVDKTFRDRELGRT